MKIAALLSMILICAGCAHQLGDQFFLTERHSGHRFGPFQHRTGEDVVIGGKQFRLSVPRVSDQHSQIVTRMKGVILPTVDFRHANLHDAIDFLATAGNVSLVLSLDQDRASVAILDPFADQDDPFATGEEVSGLPLINLQAKDVSAYDALNIVCELANMSWSIENSVVMIRGPEGTQEEDFPEKWEYDGSFHDLVDIADRIIIRNGGYNCCGSVDDDSVLLTITNPEEIAKFNATLQFETNQTWNACMCCGFPGIDWYRGKYRLALTGLQHGHALRWKGFPGDAFFTKQSSQQIAQWLLDHGIPDPHKEFTKIAGQGKLPTTESTLTSERAF